MKTIHPMRIILVSIILVGICLLVMPQTEAQVPFSQSQATITVTGSPAKAGGKITVTLNGEPGGEAAFSIFGLVKGVAMIETTAGTYTGEYAVEEGQDVRNGLVVATLKTASGTVRAFDINQLVVIDTTVPRVDATILNARSIYQNGEPVHFRVQTEPGAYVVVDASAINLVQPTLSLEETRPGVFEARTLINLAEANGGMKRIAILAMDIAGNLGATERKIMVGSPSQIFLSVDTGKPYKTSTITAYVSGSAENYGYQWYNQKGTIAGATSPTLTGAHFNKGDEIYYAVTPKDGLSTKPIPSEKVKILNSPPSLESVQLQIAPTPAYKTSLLTVQPTARDSDSDPIQYQRTWYKNGRLLKGTVDFPNEQTLPLQGAVRIDVTFPLALRVGTTMKLLLGGTLSGSVRFISSSGRVIEQPIPEVQGSTLNGSFPVTLDEIGDYTIEETVELLVRSTNPLIPVESRGKQTFTWTYPNRSTAEQMYHYATQTRNLTLDVAGPLQAHLELPNPGLEMIVPLVVREAIPANTPIVADASYRADFIKRSAIAIDDVPITTPSLSGAYFNAGDEVYVVVTATDGTDESHSIESEHIYIRNTPPRLTRVQITADTNPPTTKSVLTATAEDLSDDDGDTSHILYQWYNQKGPISEATSATFTGPLTRGDTLYVEATTFDGKEKGDALQSDRITITGGNTRPEIKSVSIFPLPAYMGDRLTAFASDPYDADGDAVQVTYQWQVLQREGEAPAEAQWQDIAKGNSLDTSGMAPDAQIRVVATPTDGQDAGEARMDTIQLGGVIRNADDTVRAALPQGSVSVPNAQVQFVPYTDSTDQAAQNSQGYYRAVGPFWQLAVVDTQGKQLKDALVAETISLTLCHQGDGVPTRGTPYVVLRLGDERLMAVDAVSDGNCLTAKVSPDGAWALGVPDIPPHPWDVNNDGAVNLLDLVTVGVRFGETITTVPKDNPDVNRDGVVNIQDLVLVGSHFGESTGTPAAPEQLSMSAWATIQFEHPRLDGNRVSLDVVLETTLPLVGYHLQMQKERLVKVDSGPKATDVFLLDADAQAGKLIAIKIGTARPWLGRVHLATIEVEAHPDGVISVDEARLVSLDGQFLRARVEPFSMRQLLPQQTRLFPNFPNPFNPETWIPFQLHKSAHVRLTIYDTLGREIRRIDLGQLPTGYYKTRERAAYWDGRNHIGEQVASGLYFYRLEADSFVSLRRMVVLK